MLRKKIWTTAYVMPEQVTQRRARDHRTRRSIAGELRRGTELVLGKGRKVHDERESIKRELDMKEARAAMQRGRR